ncbi:FAD dependent oxidoreductase [Penicillium cf. griseofulvum]|uniref:FAD dependent oxidoreductase n=1 Tax=Penicillium cf. griseofulvum TaxID=2972120 RepID=A0A9W9T191_9EURO|nr:FAD dependent oxidoreductase [Penicillium cf. griseofulvum]KAJ5437314.1 FAD dependent oxidoreductase [Penicillium cf. griseofulvum]KAJ5441460.1 FAD dependent oxidoreductase [Penicillium cf. griseofulvum]
MEHFDVAIVGLGVLGSAAAYQAALKGAKTIAFEQFELGHVREASHDTSRIVRTSNSANEYVALAKSAYRDWAELERMTCQDLLSITGGVLFMPKDGSLPVESFTTSLKANSVPYELLSSKEVTKRWPQFDIPDTVATVYTPDTGITHAFHSVATMQSLASQKGAVLKANTRVERVTPKYSSGGGVVIQTSSGQFHASKVILTTDTWTNKLLAPLGVHASVFEATRFPTWIWLGQKCFYGFPCYGEPTIKAARDTSLNFMTPEEWTFVPSAQLQNELIAFLSNFIPEKELHPLRTVTCQYTITPDRQFIISPLTSHPDIIVGLGAAHAFKFAPAFGRVLAELAIDGETKEDISKFGIPSAATCSTKL